MFGSHFLGVVRNSNKFTAGDFEAVVFEILLNAGVFLESTVDYDVVFVLVEFVNAVVDEFEFEVFERNAVLRLDVEHTLVFEHKREAARGAEVAAKLVEIAAHVGYGASVVVGGSFHNDSDAKGAVSFVYDFLVVACILVGGLLDGAVDGVLRHVCSLGVSHEGTEARVGLRVRTAGLDGDGDFLTDFSECARHIAPSFQFSCFAIFKRSSHKN